MNRMGNNEIDFKKLIDGIRDTVSDSNSFANHQTPKTIKDVDNILKDWGGKISKHHEKLLTEIEKKHQITMGIVIGALFVIGISIVGWLSESIIRSYTETIELRSDIKDLMIKNINLENDIKNIQKDKVINEKIPILQKQIDTINSKIYEKK